MYTVDYFIKKFEAIPENMWNDNIQQDDNGTRCALGHCLPEQVRAFGSNYYQSFGSASNTNEGMALMKLFNSHKAYSFNSANWITDINNGQSKQYRQPTPKQRILAALYDIKRLQSPKEEITYKNVEIEQDILKIKVTEEKLDAIPETVN